jgi:hypothetical protein
MDTTETKDWNWEAVMSLQLKSVAEKLRSKKGWWWNASHDMKRLSMEYRQFLYLVISNPDTTVVPWSQDLDDFWHEHILDTAKYAEDCRLLNGGFIHHNPHMPKGTAEYQKGYQTTREKYIAAFGKTSRFAGEREVPKVICSGGTAGCGGHGGHGGGHGHGCGHGGGHGCGGHGCGGHGCGGGH